MGQSLRFSRLFIKCSLSLVIGTSGVNEFTPVKAACIKCGNKHLGGSNIGRKGNVVHVAKAEEILLCLGGLLRHVGASEIEDKVDFVVGYS